MHHFALAILLTLLFTERADARLGWTLQQCEEKYGKASILNKTGKTFDGSATEATFNYEGWRILVAWFPNSSEAQFIRYTSNAGKMTNEQLEAILNSNAMGQKWKPHFDGQNQAGVEIASELSGSDMRSGYYQREDGAQTGTIMLWAINNVGIKSAWLIDWEQKQKAADTLKKTRVPNL